MNNISLRDYFAIKILQKLMERHEQQGYTDRAAIAESYKLASDMIEYKNFKKFDTSNLEGK